MTRRRIAMWLPLTAMIFALLVRLLMLGRKSLWLDEAATLRIAATSVEDIVSGRWDQHPPIYYLLMRCWIRLGRGEFILRLPSALVGVAAIPLLDRLMRQWGSRWVAMASAWLLAIAPLHIWYSQEARMYALVCTLGLASTLSYAVAIRRDSPLAWLAWSVATLAGLYTQYSMLLIVFAQMVLFGPLWRESGSRRPALWSPLLALLAVALLFAPQARKLLAQIVLSDWRGGYYYLWVQSILAGWNIAISPTQLYVVIVLAGVVVLGAVSVAAWALRERLKQARVGPRWAMVAVVIYLLILVASAIPRGLGLKRQVSVLLPYALSGVAAVISTHPYRSRLFLGLVLVTLPLTGYVVLVQEQEAWRDAAQFLEQRSETQDVILVNAAYMRQPFEYYYHGDVSYLGIGPDGVPETLSEIAESHRRLWLVLSNEKYTDPQGLVRRWLDRNCTWVEERTFRRVRVRLYDSR